MAARSLALSLLLLAAVSCSSALQPRATFLGAGHGGAAASSTAALSVSELPAVVASALGCADEELDFDGVAAGNLFDRPQAAVTLIVPLPSDVAADAQPFAAVPGHALTGHSSAGDVVDAMSHLSSSVCDVTGQSGCVVGLASDRKVAAAAASSHRLSLTLSRHTLTQQRSLAFATPDGARVAFDATANALDITLADGRSVSFDTTSNLAAGALVVELTMAASALGQLGPDCTHTATTLVLSTLPAFLEAAGDDGVALARVVVEALATELERQLSQAGTALLIGVVAPIELDLPQVVPDLRNPAARASAQAQRTRRASSSQILMSSAAERAEDPFCETFAYFCYTSDGTAQGTPFGANNCDDPTCEDGKKPDGSVCHCAWDGCPEGSATVTARRCRRCKEGYTLSAGVCYVDSNTSMVTNIVIWLGLAIAIALVATCYTIGGMDPGRDGIVYRMTSQRIKSQ
eukprot:m.480454 g.480454  ORF g.480454 m.480454 type:complete len:462 (-) comp21843_c0_seq1:142-1527(-)